jgi:predicted metal-dependent peptidase
MAQHKAEQRIERSHLAIMKHPSFCVWSGLLFIGGWEIDDTLPTAKVDYKGHVFYGRSFIDGCQSAGGIDKEVNYIVLHENGHKALMHCTRAYKLYQIDHEATMEAVDQVVNNMIEDIDPEHKFAEMPKHIPGFFDRKYTGMSLREVFDAVRKNGKQSGRKPQDEHEFALVEGDKDPATKDQVAALEKQIDNALRSGSYLAGKMGGKQNRTLTDILTPKIDWKDALRDFVVDSFVGDDEASWRRPNRRFVGVDWYLPSMVSEAVGELVTAIDTSGSIGQREMTAMLSEVIEIANVVHPSGIRIIYWSDGVESEEYYTPDQFDDILRLTKPVGGGGTTLSPVPLRIKELENIQCAIVLTDGYVFGDWGDWTVPVLFAITTDVTAPIGKTVHFEVEY